MSKVTLDAYLFFKGNCKEAMNFYKDVFGGELHIQSFGEVPADSKPEGADADKVMHSTLKGGLIDLMASDSTTDTPFGLSPVSLSLSGTDEETLTEVFHKLSEGGKVFMPLKKEFWGDTFGSTTDKYGIDWMVNISPAKDGE